MSKKKEPKKARARLSLSPEEHELIMELRETGVIPDEFLIRSDIAFAKLKEKLTETSRRYEKSLEKLEEKESTIEHLLALQESASVKPTPLAKSSKKKVGDATAIMVASDWHVEEQVDPSTVNGLNEYNLDIAEKRASEFFRKGLFLTNLVRNGIKINRLVLAILGDLITGYIHDENQESNYLSPTEASLFVQDILCAGIDFLLKEGGFQEVIVPCCWGNHSRCHDETTELLTRDGWRKYNEIEVGDLVATYNMDTGVNEWQPLKDVYVADYSGPMIHVNTMTADYMVTPHHRMVVRSHNGPDKFVEMQDIVKEGTFGSLNWPKCSMGHDIDLPDITDDELRLLGWIMTDGSYESSRKNKTVRIYQSKQDSLGRLVELINGMGLKYSISTRDRDIVQVCGKAIKSSLPENRITLKVESSKRIVELLPNRKIVPDWMRDLSSRQFYIFLNGLLEGDGSISKNESVLYGVREFLEQIQELAVINGIPARLRTDNRDNFILSLPKSVRGYINNFNESVKEVYYQGVIWCGTVENGTLITRRNGIPLVSGNTTKKKRHSTSYKNSYEWMMYKNLENIYKNNKKVRFIVQNSYHAYLSVYDNFTIRFHHGDNIRYGGGVGGITIPVNKAIAQWEKSRHADLDVFGHFHQQMMDCGSFVANGCFTPNMMVTMQNGSRKQIQDVAIGEKVLCVGGEINQVLNKLVRPHNNRVMNVVWQGLFSKITCTPNHEFWAIKKNQVEQSVRVGTENRKAVYQRTTNFVSPDWIAAEYLSEGDYINLPFNRDEIDDDSFSTDYCRLLGFYLAEGSIAKYFSGTLGQIDFSFHYDEKEYADFVWDQIKIKYDIEARKTERKNKTTRHVILSNKEIAASFYNLCGKGAKTKVLSDVLMFLPPHKQKQILYGWILGDGHLTKKYGKKGRFRLLSVTSISYDLVNQMMIIALRCGFKPKMYSQDSGGPRKNRSYSLNFSKKDAEEIALDCGLGHMIDFEGYRETGIGMIEHNEEIFVPIESIWSEQYSANVYDLEVENNHSYVINGIGVHNSLIGWNAFAISIKASYDIPKQSFFVIDKEKGKICDWPIFVEH